MAKTGASEEGIFIYRPPKETLKAWEPFWDAVNVLFVLVETDVDEDKPEWKIWWIAGVALLRVIGHVMAKIDARSSPQHQTEIDQLWAAWKSDRAGHAVFWEFIEQERNNILKTYEFGATVLADDHGARVVLPDGDSAFGRFGDALYWWRDQLEELEGKFP